MAVTRRRSKLWWRTAHQSKALVEPFYSVKTRFKAFCGEFLSKICMRPWIRSLSNILLKRPLRDDFWTFEISKNMFPGIFFGFDICNLKLFAITNRLSIVWSLQNIKNTQFVMILMSKKCHFRKNIENQFLLVLKYVKKYAEFESAVHFAWNLQKWWVFCMFVFFS